MGHPIIKFTPVPPGWVIKAGDSFYDVLGWTEDGTPVVGTGQSIATLRSIQGEDPFTIMTETTYREEYNH